MAKTLSIYLFLLITVFTNLLAQDLNLIGRANIGIGFDYLTQDFKGIKTFYSPGGGLGLEAGLEGELPNDLYWYGTLGMTFNLNFHYEEVSGVTTKTSFSWNKKFFAGGVNKYFDLRNKYIDDFYGGGGLLLGIPGIMRRTVNGDYKGRINYRPAVGFQIHGGVTLTLFDNFLLRPELRYRLINYNAKSDSPGLSSEPELKKAHGEGLDISLSIVKQIKGRRR
jgi:hypothetical protein